MKLSAASTRLLVVLAGALVAAVSATAGCGGSSARCGPSNCEGCCDAEGTCVQVKSQSNGACGVDGASCRQCTPGNACTNGRCLGAQGCGPSTCDGCCAGGSCVSLALTNDNNCGFGGEACAACPSTQRCSGGLCETAGSSCNPTSCPTGCCNNGTCVQPSGQSANACGKNGGACVACGSGQSCSNGACSSSCGNVGLACCSGSICFTGQCVGGTCTSGTGGGTGGGAGGGSGGGAGGGAGGGGGSTATKAIGDACASSTECLSGTCGGGRFSGGYCTQGCTTNANCPTGSACGKDPNDGTGFTKVCLKLCSTAPAAPGTCRSGYVCDQAVAVDGNSDLCTPACASGQCGSNTCDSRGFCCGATGLACCNNSTCNSGNSCVSGYCRQQVVDAGTGYVGDPCTANSQCTGSFCELQVNQGGSSNCVTTACWPGGYCRPSCSGVACPTGSSCSTYLATRCLLNCAWTGGQSTCRSGYVCDRGWIASNPAQGICIYRCGSASDCPTNSQCVNGFCCGLPGYACCGGLNGTCNNGAACNSNALCP